MVVEFVTSPRPYFWAFSRYSGKAGEFVEA
jgi:hypothetical protein